MGVPSRLTAAPCPLQDLAVPAMFGGLYLLAAELSRSLAPTEPALLGFGSYRPLLADVARGLSMRAVAPGVSDDSTLGLPSELGFEYAQGAAVAPARPVTDLPPSSSPAVPRA